MATNLFQSTTFKVLGIGFLALLMLIPLAQVQGLIGERSSLREQAVDAIARRWGAQQQLGGPVLAIPKRTRVQTSTGWITRESTEILLPDRLDIRGTLAPETRRYGIYDTPVYTAELKLNGSFAASDFRALGSAETTYLWDRAELRLPVGDVRGIRRVSPLGFAGAQYNLGPGDGDVGNVSTIAVALDLSKPNVADIKDNLPFELELTLAGTQSLGLLPLARHTEAVLSAPWADPSFDGAFLPAERRVDATGFDAHWQVLDLNRSFGQHWQQDAEHVQNLRSAGFGVDLYQPAGVYQQNERAGKYGVLFIVLTFIAFFLFEVLKKLRVHPVQYLLIGLALTTFYVVLLALSEQVGFALAYLAAAAAVVVMVAGYAAALLRSRRTGLSLGALLALVYALLYGLIVSEQYSLLMGALALLAIMAALMYFTRKVDWYTNYFDAAVSAAPR
ncbi:MAG: cell envelope integrity protein CreD [Rudaea sp.]|nr:cell envelope integrity protein CreD [Rudaea sp.]